MGLGDDGRTETRFGVRSVVSWGLGRSGRTSSVQNGIPAPTALTSLRAPPSHESHPRKRGARFQNSSVVAMVGVVGVVMAHYPMLASGFRRIQTDLGDSRLIHYLLEHGYRWMLRERGHERFWSPPFFYPVENVEGYSDTLLGVGPVYWVWRLLGFSVDVSFGLWMVSVSVLNYLAGLLLFTSGLKFGLPAAAGGAALVAFGAPRVNQMGHQQLLPCFYVLLAVYALAKLARSEVKRPISRGGYWLLAVVSVVAQLYSGVYLGWFLAMAIGVAAVAAVVLPSSRIRALRILWTDFWMIVGSGLIGLLLLLPFLIHYGQTEADVKFRYYAPNVVRFHPRILSWFHMGEGSLVWGWMAGREPFRSWTAGDEHHLGIGILTLAVCALGLVLGRRRPMCQLAFAVAVASWLATTFLPGEAINLVGMAMALYCLAALFHHSEDRQAGGAAVVAIMVLLWLSRFPNRYVLVLGVSTILLCLLELTRARGDRGRTVWAAIALSALSLLMFPFAVIWEETLVVAVVMAILGYRFPKNRDAIALGAVWLLIFLLIATVYLERGYVVSRAALAVPIALAVSAATRERLPAGVLPWGLVVALPAVTLFTERNSLWLEYWFLVPEPLEFARWGGWC